MVDTPILDPPHDAPTTSRKMSFEEFLKVYDGRHAEWLPDGTVEERVGTAAIHIKLIQWLVKLLETYLEYTQAGEVFSESYVHKPAPELAGREPDILVVMQANRARITPTYLDGPADIVIEIVSPESVERDYGTKFREYEMGGVREYWIIDPERLIADVYELGENRLYRRLETGAEARLVSHVLSRFSLDKALLWDESKPTTGQTLRLVAEMLGVPVESLLK